MQAVGYKFLCALDETPGLAGKTIGGVPVFPLDHIRGIEEETLIVICANKPDSILAMASRLNSLGLTWGKHYTDCSMLQFESMLPRIRQQLSIIGSYDTFSFVRLLSFYLKVANLSYVAGTWLLVELLEHCGKSIHGPYRRMWCLFRRQCTYNFDGISNSAD